MTAAIAVLGETPSFSFDPVSYTHLPKPYWANTSSNSLVRALVERADSSVKQEMEELIAGGTIEKPVHEDITYDEVYKTCSEYWENSRCRA